MTYSVPYSFVPGTKAKADEVNANFMSVLSSIDEINTDVKAQNSTNADKFTEIESGINDMKTNIETAKSDIKNLQTNLNSKANSSDIDGKWTKCNKVLLTATTCSKTYNQTFDLTSLLKENAVYEILVTAFCKCLASANTGYGLDAKTTLCEAVQLCYADTRVNAYASGDGSCVVPIGTDRKLTLTVHNGIVNDSLANGCWASIAAYRKVR